MRAGVSDRGNSLHRMVDGIAAVVLTEPCRPQLAGAQRRFEAVEPALELIRIRVLELAEDVASLLPRRTGGPHVERGAPRVAEAGQRFGLLVPVAELPEQVGGVLEAVGGPLEFGHVAVSVAEALPGPGLPVAGA